MTNVYQTSRPVAHNNVTGLRFSALLLGANELVGRDIKRFGEDFYRVERCVPSARFDTADIGSGTAGNE